MSGPPNWRDMVRADVAALPDSRRPRESDLVKATTDFRLGAHTAVTQAARLRGVTVAAYLRRAAYAMAAHDLGLGLHELTSRDDRMANGTGYSIPDPHGTRFGVWEIESLRGEDADA